MVDLPGLVILVSVLECFAWTSVIPLSDVRPSLILLSLILVSVPEYISSSIIRPWHARPFWIYDLGLRSRMLLNLGHSPNWWKAFLVWCSWSPFSNAPKPSSLTQVMVDLPGLMILVSVLECFAWTSVIHPSDVRPSWILLSLILVSVPEYFSSSIIRPWDARLFWIYDLGLRSRTLRSQ